MKRFLVFFAILGGGFLYSFLALLNLRLESENSGLREKKLLLERDRKLVIFEISQVSLVKNLTEVYSTIFDSPRELEKFSFFNDFQPIGKLSERLAVSQKKKEQEIKENLVGDEIVSPFSISQQNR